jgi:hypothetical protein
MGDIADDMYDAEMDMREEFEDEIELLLSNEDKLRKNTSLWRSPKIMSIRKWPFPLTHKQKWCLAMWIYNQDAQ